MARQDRRRHGLDNWQEFLRTCPTACQGVILCGHVHRCYHVISDENRAIFCAGSLSMEGKEGFWLLDLNPGLLRAVPGIWRQGAFRLDPAREVSIETAC